MASFIWTLFNSTAGSISPITVEIKNKFSEGTHGGENSLIMTPDTCLFNMTMFTQSRDCKYFTLLAIHMRTILCSKILSSFNCWHHSDNSKYRWFGYPVRTGSYPTIICLSIDLLKPPVLMTGVIIRVNRTCSISWATFYWFIGEKMAGDDSDYIV